MEQGIINGSTGYIYSKYLTTTQPKAEEQKPKEQPKNEEKSTNKNLAKLEVKLEGLTPEFKKMLQTIQSKFQIV